MYSINIFILTIGIMLEYLLIKNHHLLSYSGFLLAAVTVNIYMCLIFILKKNIKYFLFMLF